MATSLDNQAVIAAGLALCFGPVALAVLLAWLGKRRPARPPAVPPRFKVTLADYLQGSEYVGIGGGLYLLSPASVATVRFLRQAARWRAKHAPTTPLRLIEYRDDFRRLVQGEPLAGLVWVLKYGEPEARWIAVWLLGNCGDRRAIAVLKPLRRHPNPRIRKQAVRSLKRLGAVESLEAIAAEERDPVVKELAMSGLRKPFSNRLSRYLQGVEGASTADEPPGMDWFLAHELDEPVPPKSRSFIRRLLEHIRRLVHPSPADEEVRAL